MASSRRLMFTTLLLSSSLFITPSISASSPPKVSLALYYETLCPYCSNFIVNYLAKIFDNGLISIVDLDLIPYGNAKVGSNNTITCQHGPYECLLNTIEACALSAWPDVNVHFSFINCVESLVVEHRYLEWDSCFSTTGLDSQPVMECYENGTGQKLELQYAAKTDSLQPPHRYVPWVVVNGKPLYDDYETFEAEVCKAYKGDLPEACNSVSLLLRNPFEKKAKGSVCLDNKINRPISNQNDQLKIQMVV